MSAQSQARVWGFSKNVMIFHLEMMCFTQFCRTVLSIVTGIFSVYLWIFICVLQESLGTDALTGEYSWKFCLGMCYLTLFGVLNY